MDAKLFGLNLPLVNFPRSNFQHHKVHRVKWVSIFSRKYSLLPLPPPLCIAFICAQKMLLIHTLCLFSRGISLEMIVFRSIFFWKKKKNNFSKFLMCCASQVRSVVLIEKCSTFIIPTRTRFSALYFLIKEKKKNNKNRINAIHTL